MVGAARSLTRRAAAAGALALLGAAPPSPVTAFAGRYSHHFENGLIGGSTYGSDHVVEIVPVDRRHAYVRAELQFYNGHSCSLAGVAASHGATLVYRGLANDVRRKHGPVHAHVSTPRGRIGMG